jgi:hypothetical protein
MKQCILNQTQGYWLLYDALNVALLTSVHTKSDSTIWDYPFQSCEGGFWIWIRGIVGVYDGKNSGYIHY